MQPPATATHLHSSHTYRPGTKEHLLHTLALTRSRAQGLLHIDAEEVIKDVSPVLRPECRPAWRARALRPPWPRLPPSGPGHTAPHLRCRTISTSQQRCCRTSRAVLQKQGRHASHRRRMLMQSSALCKGTSSHSQAQQHAYHGQSAAGRCAAIGAGVLAPTEPSGGSAACTSWAPAMGVSPAPKTQTLTVSAPAPSWAPWSQVAAASPAGPWLHRWAANQHLTHKP